jgi:glycogen synthase
MRVLVWSEFFLPYIGGPEVLLPRLIGELEQRGHEFLVVTSHGNLDLPDDHEWEGTPVRRLPLRTALAARDLAAIREMCEAVSAVKREFAPDVVHVTGHGPSLFFHLRTLGSHPAPWLLWLQREVFSDKTNRRDTLLHEAMASADWVAACAETVLDQARRVAPEMEERSSVIRNAAAVAVDAVAPPRAPRLLSLGRLVPVKGVDIALAAVARLVERFPEVHLTIAGDGHSRSDLERQAADLGLEGRVDFVGWVAPDDVARLIDDAAVLVMPSRSEGLPVAAVEVAARARPIVASRVGGLPEVVKHEMTGMLVEPEDAADLAEALAFLLEHPEDAARMGRAAQERVRDTLSLQRCADSFDDLYRVLTRKRQWSR